VQNGASLWVYDTGPAFERFSNARAVLTPYLESQSFDPMLSGLIVSHGDMDHAGESEWFADYFSPRTIWIGEPKRTPLKQTSTGCALGQSWEWASNSSSLRVDVLWPRKGYQATSANNHSCVVRFTLNGTAFLVMGDLEGEGERAMLAWMAEHHMLAELKADVLIAGHHGAEAASSMTLLKHVKPEYVVFSAGYLNRFRHPSSGAQARVKRISAQALNTFDTGAIAFSVRANNEKGGLLEPKLSRQRATDYWVLE
jgi:competence protein ComEC